MTFTTDEFEGILDAAATLYNMAYDCDYQEGIVNLAVAVLLPELDDLEQASILMHRALKGS